MDLLLTFQMFSCTNLFVQTLQGRFKLVSCTNQDISQNNICSYALIVQMGFVAQVEKSRYDPYPRRSYATAGTATVVGHPSCVNRLSKATRTCNSVT